MSEEQQQCEYCNRPAVYAVRSFLTHDTYSIKDVEYRDCISTVEDDTHTSELFYCDECWTI